MRRFFSAAAFFVLLILLWQWVFQAKIWSPVLLPSPLQVLTYLKGAIADGTLGHATVTIATPVGVGSRAGPFGPTGASAESPSDSGVLFAGVPLIFLLLIIFIS